MTTQDLFNRLTEANFSFTKPCNAEEIIFLNEQKKSLDKLIICGLAEKISENKYSLSADGRKAHLLGVKKWAKSLTDIERRVLVYNFFEFKYSWYNRPTAKAITLKQTTSTISNLSIKAMGILISLFVLPLLVMIVWERYKIEILNIWNSCFN
jgi:hypothetical protein